MNPTFFEHRWKSSRCRARNSSMSCVLIFLFAFLLASNVHSDSNIALGGYRILAEDSVISFPFEIYHGDIRFIGEINGHEVRMLLDDGFMWDQLLFWGSPRVDALGFDYDGEIEVGGSKSGNNIPSKTASGITVSFPGVEFYDLTAIITPHSSGVSKMWSGSEGQISAAFFKNFVVDIDFDKMMITLIEPDKFEYHGRGVEVPLKPLGNGPSAIPAKLELADGRTISLDLLMDLGYNDQLELGTGRENNINVPQGSLPEGLGRNISGEVTMGHVGRLPLVEIGGYAIKDAVVAYVSEEHSKGKYSEVMIGLGLLSRFNIVYDYPHQRLFLEPNQSFSEPFEYNMSGMTMKKNDSGEYQEIIVVHENSPAGEAGLQVGDKIIRIDGQPAAEYDYWKLRPLLQQEGATLHMVILRDDKEKEVSIILRRMI